jgi:cation-transporting ATPase I
MSGASVASPQAPVVVHSVRGRFRIHLPLWSGKAPRRVAQRLRALDGVTRAEVNTLTKNALILFDPNATTEAALLEQVRDLQSEFASYQDEEQKPPPAASVSREGQTVRARITVRGMDRDPRVARKVVERLRQRHPGVHVKAFPITGRVLVEFSHEIANLDEIIETVSDVELPEEPNEDNPADPLDPRPVIQSGARALGSILGLALIGAQRLPGVPSPLVDPNVPATVNGVIGILRGFPFLRNGARKLLGRDIADLLFSIPDIVSQALANSPIGLSVASVESLRLFTEARSRQDAWRRYAERLEGAQADTPGTVIRLESGERAPRRARVIEGFGTATDRSARPISISPDSQVPAGARLFGGPFVVELLAHEAFQPYTRPAPLRPTIYDSYTNALSLISASYATGSGLLTRSFSRAFTGLLLVSPRAAVIGMEAADLDARARVLRAGVTIAGVRPDRTIRRPDLVLLDGPRLLSTRLEISAILPSDENMEVTELHAIASGVAVAAGAPWNSALGLARGAQAEDGRFDGQTASARIDGGVYTLSPVQDWSQTPQAAPVRQRGDFALELRREDQPRPLAIVALRPRLVAGVRELVEVCQRARVDLAMLPGSDDLMAQGVARRAGIAVLSHDDAIQAIRSRQAQGDFVAFVSDGAHAAAAFNACDLAIGLTDGHSPLAARADLVAFEFGAVAAIVRAGVARDRAVRDAVVFSIAANIAGAVWGIQGQPGVRRASLGVYIAALAALADGWLRLRGGERPQSALASLVDPHPERWGQRSVAETLRALGTSEQGLSAEDAARRSHEAAPAIQRRSVLEAISEQLRSPLTAILGVGALASLLLGAPADVAIIGGTIAANVAIGAWQERQASKVSEALERLSAASARVVRDGREITIPAGEVVPGDVLLLGSGERVTADARLIEARGLEVDEAALTGESLPALKSPDSATDASRVLLDGSDVITGSGRAVAFAVGRNTRMGTITAALGVDEAKRSPLNQRLSRLLEQVAPIAIGGGALVVGSGFLRTRSILPHLAIGATIALSAVPEGLPLLTQVSEAGVARRLAGRQAIVRRLTSVESLGRVDTLCADKTGTLTEGKLALRLLAAAQEERALPADDLPESLRETLLAAALASPRPDAPDASSHPTDVAVIRAAEEAGLGGQMRRERQAESPFDPVRAYHVTRLDDGLRVKGAPEVIIPRCAHERVNGRAEPLDDAGRARLLERAETYAARGLRVLMVAEGPADTALDDPQGLTALGFLGIKDPLKPRVRAAVRRCYEAGVRVIMLTGDHPATAAAIAREAGLLDGAQPGVLLTGAEIAGLQNGEMDERLENASVIARATPLDKLRIIESLQRHGHTVAMTGDGVNDAPALRLADAGVAMGRGGAEVARQIADVVIADDDFATLVEAFVEGRGFWRNIRRAIGLLLGGNLGELGLVVGASALGFASPLTARQALIVNAITDILPGLAVGLQQPETRRLSNLAREGTTPLDRSLWNDVTRRGAFTGVPSLAGYLVALTLGDLPQARAVAFASVVGSQLAQTLDLGRTEGVLSGPVVGAVVGSAGVMGLGLAVPALRSFLGLALPPPAGWALIGGATLSALALSRIAEALASSPPPRLALPAPGATS